MAKDEDSIYDEEEREEMADDSEISPEEEGFMQGYEGADEEKDEVSEDREDSKQEEE